MKRQSRGKTGVCRKLVFRRNLFLAMLLPMLTLLCACSSTPNTPNSSLSPSQETTLAETRGEIYNPTVIPTTIPTSIPETTPPEPVFVYEKAVEDFLLPLDEYSWERKYTPEFVMIHFTSAVTNHRNDPYNIDLIRGIFVEYNVSVHYIIERDGTVHCYVPEDRVAWHAGKGSWNDDPAYTDSMNQYAIGIELVGMGSQSDMSVYLTKEEYEALDISLPGFTDDQYESLKDLVSDICRRYNIAMDRQHIIGHEEYSPTKTDPGELFDWSRLIQF